MKSGEDGCDPKAAPRLRGAADAQLRRRLEGDVARSLRAKELAESRHDWDVPILEADVPKPVRASYGQLIFHIMQTADSAQEAERALNVARLLLARDRVREIRRRMRLAYMAAEEARQLLAQGRVPMA